MTSPDSHAFDAEAPARTVLRPIELAAPWSGQRAARFEIVSRGDLVPGLLIQPPERAGARPALLLLGHDAGASLASPDFAPLAAWIASGVALAAIDLPLHGARASAKLSERLVGAAAALERGEALDRNGALLFEEFMRQARSDLARSLDALLETGAVDPKRVGFLGLGLGARIGTALLDHEDRFAAAVLARATGGAVAHPASDGRPTARLDVELDRRRPAWVDAARRFLGSSLGF